MIAYQKLIFCFILLFNFFAYANSLEKELTILHTNDMHSKLFGINQYESMCNINEKDTDKCLGGFDRIAYKVDEIKATNKNVLVLDSGDQFNGSMFHLIYNGLASAKLMNLVGYNAMAVGNHEFDNGPVVFSEFISELKFPILSCNIDASQSPELKDKIKPYTIIDLNNTKVGIIGFTTPDTSFLSSPGDKVKFLPLIPSIKQAIQKLQAAKVDVIIGLSHSGLIKDIEIAKQVSGMAVIISAHTNSLLSNLQPNKDGPCPMVIMAPNKKPVLLVSAYAYGKFLGYLKFSFNAKGEPTKWQGEPILLDNTVPKKESVTKVMLELYKPILNFEKQIVGNIPLRIDGNDCRFHECAFGNFLADSMLSFGKKMGAKIALVNGGGIRSSAAPGNVSNAQLMDILPFDKKLVFLKLSGQHIWQALEHGTNYVHDKKNDNTGRFLQVSGLKYVLNPTNPIGQRVISVSIQNDDKSFSSLEKTKIYPLVTNTYMANGGDDYVMFKNFSEKWTLDITMKALVDAFLKTPHSQLPYIDGRVLKIEPKI